ncbi:MAG: 50S ribosomal protein L24 [Puniceicoccales bacterium]|jgi:large subunit ribosomal protein L24|nr:50S ribosomal protein L24 [Puniceicoccales bacterium]
MKNTLKRGDTVVVIAGDDKGKVGKIVSVFKKKNSVIVEGVAVARKHIRKSQEYPEGAITEKYMPIHVSNVKLKVVGDSHRNEKA